MSEEIKEAPRSISIGEELVRMRGHVLESNDREIEVYVDVEYVSPNCEFDIEVGTNKKRSMNIESFIPSGIIAEEMPFIYRIYRTDRGLYTEITPDRSASNAEFFYGKE
jgi:hypothetical protein